jgi:YD repeat-containing protein
LPWRLGQHGRPELRRRREDRGLGVPRRWPRRLGDPPHFDGEAFETLAYTYDHAGRVVAQVSPGADGAEALTTWQHAPGVSVRTDALGVQERVEFDFLTEERLLNGLSRRFVVRDAYGRLLSDTDATGLTREIAYDALTPRQRRDLGAQRRRTRAAPRRAAAPRPWRAAPR